MIEKSKFFFLVFFVIIIVSNLSSYPVAADFQYPIIGGWEPTFDLCRFNLGWGYHAGEDMSLAPGTPVYAIGNGIVREAKIYNIYDDDEDYGAVIVVEHNTGSEHICSIYGHLSQELNLQVNKNDFVEKGQLIGYIAYNYEDGGNWSPHLHLGIRKGIYSEIIRGYEDSCEIVKANYYNPTSDPEHGEGFINAHLHCPLSGDWDGDGIDSFGYYDNCHFYLDNALNIPFGMTGDFPIIGDWNGDGTDDIGLFRADEAGESKFYLEIINDGECGGAADYVIPFGYYPDDIPLAGDWDGDGDDDIGGYYPGNSTFYLYTLDMNSSSAIHLLDISFGQHCDYPVAGDWDCDGDDDIGIFRTGEPNTETNNYYFDIDLSGGQAEYSVLDFGSNGYGNIGDFPVIGDWDGDGDDNVGIFRSSDPGTPFDKFYYNASIPDINTCNTPPSIPTAPSGPSEGTCNTSYSFSTSSSDPDGDSIEYRFDWGDGQISDWGNATQSHMWSSSGSFTIKAQARDEHGAVSSWSSGTIMTISTIHEVTMPVCPSGETNGYTNTTYSFNTTGASCSEGHAVEYRFDWGDGIYSNWSVSESATHSWSMSGSYLVRAQARCSVEQDILSEWSDGLSVTITQEIIEYSLTISATVGGTTQPSPGTYSYNVGEHIEIQAIPNDFYDFSHWSGDINDVRNPISIKMDSDKSITANFTQGGPIEFISSIDTPNYARGVKVSGNYAYIADGESSLRIIDITDTENPIEISSYNTPGDAKKVALSGSYAYIADYTSGLRIINISNPSNPIESGYYDSPGDARDVYVNETYAYLADGYSGLRIINISDPSNPYEIGFFDTQGSAYGIDVKDQIAYVADFTGGLRIIDCSDPNNPEEIGSFITSNVIKDISIYDFKAYIACDTDGIKIVDIENPAATAELGSYSNNSFSNALRKTGSFVYIADGGKGLRILDVHSSSDPFLLAAYDTSGHTFDVDTKDNYIYVADGIEGLKILRYIPPHTVETPIKPNGPSNGLENTEYSFSTQEDLCSMGHALEYQFDWGDGSFSSWLSSPASSHFWSNSGVYNIRVRARCMIEADIISGWSESSAITIESTGVFYDLILSTTSGGTTIPTPGTYSYEENNQVEIEANPYQGYIFSHWTGNGSVEKSNDNPLVITMDSDKSLTANFTTCQIPAEPMNPNPIHNAASVSINTNLDWSDCSGAEEYDVYFGTDANPGFYVNTSESTYDIPVLNNNTTYYWKIIAKNACGNNESPIWQFTTSSSQGMYSSPSHYQVIPEVFWAPSSGGGTWMTNVQITDATGGSQVSIYFNSISGERRGPFLLNTMNVNTSIKINNILELINDVDSGFDYYGTVGAMEFLTQDETHKIQVIARTKNGNYSKTFQGLNLNDDNTATTDRIMMIQNLSSNELFRSSYGGFNPSDDSISVRYELIDKTGTLVGSSFTKTFSPKQFIAFFPFKEAGIDYPEQSFSNTWLKIIPTTGNGEIISYGATVNNLTNDPAVHTAIQFSDISGYNSPSNHQIIPEVMWAPASFGGTWLTEIQVVDMSGGSELWLAFYAHTGEKRGPFNLGAFSSQYSSGSAKNILAVLNNIDIEYDYYGKVGAIEFMTQDSHHKIQVMARTYNGNFSKTIQGLNHNIANTASQERIMIVQNLKSDGDYRSTFGGFNPTSESITVDFTLIDENGNSLGQSFTENFPGKSFKAFFPFKEAGVSYPSFSNDNVWIKIEVISGNGEIIIYGSTTNNHTNDPAYHRGIQYR